MEALYEFNVNWTHICSLKVNCFSHLSYKPIYFKELYMLGSWIAQLTPGFSDQCYRPRKLSSQIVPNRIELLLSAYQTDFLPLEDGTISGQGWTRTNDVSVVGDLQSLAFAARLPTQSVPSGIWTQDHLIKSQVLCQLS